MPTLLTEIWRHIILTSWFLHETWGRAPNHSLKQNRWACNLRSWLHWSYHIQTYLNRMAKFDYILHPPTVMYVPDCLSLSASQHIFTCRPYLMLFTKKVEIVSPLCELMTEIFWSKAMVSLLSSISLNVSQLPSLQNLKVCALVHCTLETSTWAKAADGNVNANKANEVCRNTVSYTHLTLPTNREV